MAAHWVVLGQRLSAPASPTPQLLSGPCRCQSSLPSVSQQLKSLLSQTWPSLVIKTSTQREQSREAAGVHGSIVFITFLSWVPLLSAFIDGEARLQSHEGLTESHWPGLLAPEPCCLALDNSGFMWATQFLLSPLSCS